MHVSDTLQPARIGVPLQVQKRKTSTHLYLEWVADAQHRFRDLFFRIEKPMLVLQQRRERSRAATRIPLLYHDVRLPYLEQRTHRGMRLPPNIRKSEGKRCSKGDEPP